mgnify:CR=1 FL=1|jgi:leader peptidase (prepilin peptidase)/N-methyltransferase
MNVELLLELWALLIGLVVGSFLNVVIVRLPAGASLIRPGSTCPGCSTAIRWFDNIPVLSYLLLRGRCRACGERISPRYPAIEMLTGLLFLACAARYGLSAEAAAAALFCSLMVVLGAIDIEHFILPDILTLPGILVGLALQPWLPGSLLDAITGALMGAGLLILVINVWFWLRDEEGMGLGDVNMLALIGAFLGWQGMLGAFFFATLVGAAAGIVMVLTKRLAMGSRLPFGLFLALGGLAALFARDGWIVPYLQGP